MAEEVASRVNHPEIMSHEWSDADSDDEVVPHMLPDESPPESESESVSNDGGIPLSGSGDGAGSAQELPEHPTGDDGVVRSENSDGSPVVYRPSCLSTFCDVEDLYAYLLVRGALQLTEEMYDIVRAGFNVYGNERLPSMSYIRRIIAPVVSSWMLPLHVAEVPLSCGTGSVNVRYILPSAPVRPDAAFAATCDLFFAAEKRSADDRSLHPGARPQRCPTSGVKNGERFLVVSFCFSSDVFQARRGRSASVGGVYFSYLTWQYEDRRSSGASRTISATPPGVDSYHILRAITSDLVRGATQRWLGLKHDGSLLRVYADVCMLVGDCLQVTKTSMMLGYSAKTQRPLCDYRCPAVPGSKFAHPGSSSDVEMARTTPRTTSICRAVSAALSALDES